MKRPFLFLLAIVLLVAVCSVAGCTTLSNLSVQSPSLELLSLDSNDGRNWHATFLIMNPNDCALGMDIYLDLYDQYGNAVGSDSITVSRIGAYSSKTVSATVQSSRYINMAYLSYVAEPYIK